MSLVGEGKYKAERSVFHAATPAPAIIDNDLQIYIFGELRPSRAPKDTATVMKKSSYHSK